MSEAVSTTFGLVLLPGMCATAATIGVRHTKSKIETHRCHHTGQAWISGQTAITDHGLSWPDQRLHGFQIFSRTLASSDSTITWLTAQIKEAGYSEQMHSSHFVLP
jgi:hypothetical protein